MNAPISIISGNPVLDRLSDRLTGEGVCSRIDACFGLLMIRLSGGEDQNLFLASVLVSRATREGNICLELSRFAGQKILEKDPSGSAVTCPDLSEWTSSLGRSRVVGNGCLPSPMVLDSKYRLYLRKFWEYEKSLADAILKRAGKKESRFDGFRISKLLGILFPEIHEPHIDLQPLAALIPLLSPFCVITGGPGTGKTHSAAKILGFLAELSYPVPLRVFLTAPTGKASVRLKDSIQQRVKHLPISDSAKSMIPDEAFTLHRLLGGAPGKSRFRFNPEHLLEADIVIVDEASMVDLPLMSKLFSALPENSRVILLGDRNQLASVDAGSVFGDICSGKKTFGFSGYTARYLERLIGVNAGEISIDETYGRTIGDDIIELKKTYRFSETSPIALLSRKINEGNSDEVMEILKTNRSEVLEWVSSVESSDRILTEAIVGGYTNCFRAKTPEEGVKLVERFKVLCAVNRGPRGVTSINQKAEWIFKRKDLIRKESIDDPRVYQGKPILITRNRQDLEISNGDMGVLWNTPSRRSSEEWSVCLPGLGDETRRIPLYRLPIYESAFAITVHKSQGSEFEEVLIVLPDEDIPLLTRELLYTAVTRGRQRVKILGNETVIRAMVSRQIQRNSGLRDLLWPE
jgi:exodeoxyribonuclease V alpha subunit